MVEDLGATVWRVLVLGAAAFQGSSSELVRLSLALSDMASQGATLQNYNNELVKSIEDLREKREELNRQILKEEEDKAKIQKELSILTDRLQKVNESLVRKTQARNEYDKTIQETEAAYMKILESSQTLLHALRSVAARKANSTILPPSCKSRPV